MAACRKRFGRRLTLLQSKRIDDLLIKVIPKSSRERKLRPNPLDLHDAISLPLMRASAVRRVPRRRLPSIKGGLTERVTGSFGNRLVIVAKFLVGEVGEVIRDGAVESSFIGWGMSRDNGWSSASIWSGWRAKFLDSSLHSRIDSSRNP